jgi:hypothetical protein
MRALSDGLGTPGPLRCDEYKARSLSQYESDWLASWTRKDESRPRASCFSVCLKSKKKYARNGNATLELLLTF